METLWVRRLLSEALGTTADPYHHPLRQLRRRRAHTRIHHHHLIRLVIKQGAPCLVYRPADDMTTQADALTKALPSAKV
jgi:hypothetical protein